MDNGMDFNQLVVYKLGKIESQTAEALSAINKHLSADEQFHGETDGRLKSLEYWRYWLLGAAASVSIVVSAGAAILHG